MCVHPLSLMVLRKPKLTGQRRQVTDADDTEVTGPCFLGKGLLLLVVVVVVWGPEYATEQTGETSPQIVLIVSNYTGVVLPSAVLESWLDLGCLRRVL